MHRYEASGAFDRHSELQDATRSMMDSRFGEAAEYSCEVFTAGLAERVEAACEKLFPNDRTKAQVQERVAVLRILCLFAEFRALAGIKTWAQVVECERLTLRKRPLPLNGLSSDFVNTLLKRMAEECVGHRNHEVACEVMRQLADDDEATFMAICLPAWVSPEDVSEDPAWVSNTLAASAVTLKGGEAQAYEIARRVAESYRAHLTANDKISHTMARILELNLGVFDPSSGNRVSVWEFLQMAHVEQLLTQACQRREFHVSTVFLVHTKAYLTSPVVWQLFFASFGLSADALLEGVGELVERPRKLTRWRVSEGAMSELKHRLKPLAELVGGQIRDTVQFRHLQSELAGGKGGPTSVYLTAQFMAFAASFHRTDPKLIGRMEVAIAEALRALPAVLESAHCEISDIKLQTPDDAEWQRLLAQEQAAERQAQDELNHWLAENTPKPKQETVEPASPVAVSVPVEFVYVFNLGTDGEWREAHFSSVLDRFAEDLDKFLNFHGIEVIVPVQSVAKAIQHFIFEMSDFQRRELTSGEEIAATWWRKMKRGRQRIYLLERDGQFFVNLLKRKDWTHAKELIGRF